MEDNQDSTDGVHYYWCVNCGHHGNFGRSRHRVLNCEKCNYDALTPFTLEEIQQDEHLTFQFRDVIK